MAKDAIFEVRKYNGLVRIRIGRFSLALCSNKQVAYREASISASWRNKTMRDVGGEIVMAL